MTQTAQKEYVEKCIRAARKGDVIAQNTLGYLYLNGQGVTQDYSQAASWFRTAADKQYAPAQFNLSVMYKTGQGVEQSHAESIKWLQLAANQNYELAQSNLAKMYYQGVGVMQDYEMAYMWWSLAEQSGADDVAHIKDEVAKKMTDKEIVNAKQSVQQWKVRH